MFRAVPIFERIVLAKNSIFCSKYPNVSHCEHYWDNPLSHEGNLLFKMYKCFALCPSQNARRKMDFYSFLLQLLLLLRLLALKNPFSMVQSLLQKKGQPSCYNVQILSILKVGWKMLVPCLVFCKYQKVNTRYCMYVYAPPDNTRQISWSICLILFF